MANDRQLPLFSELPEEEGPPAEEKSKTETNKSRIELYPAAPLSDAVDAYLQSLRLSGASIYTIRAFKSDLYLLGQYNGLDKPINEFSTQDLNRFLLWMLQERGVPCSPKSYARRVTTLKSFFSYLTVRQILSRDPAAAVIQRTVSPHLPDVLSEAEEQKILTITESVRYDSARPDARPHLLVTLLLQTGIKKSECMDLQLDDISRESAKEPVIWIRYKNPKLRYKERSIRISAEWLETLDEYRVQRKPAGGLFDCTARNLEYVLRDVADMSYVPPKKVSFETLRWTCALNDFRQGFDHEELRIKLGLSRVSWAETVKKLSRLAGRVGTELDH